MGFAETTDDTSAAIAHGAYTAFDSGLYGVRRNHEACAGRKITESAARQSRRLSAASGNEIHRGEVMCVRKIEFAGRRAVVEHPVHINVISEILPEIQNLGRKIAPENLRRLCGITYRIGDIDRRLRPAWRTFEYMVRRKMRMVRRQEESH